MPKLTVRPSWRGAHTAPDSPGKLHRWFCPIALYPLWQPVFPTSSPSHQLQQVFAGDFGLNGEVWALAKRSVISTFTPRDGEGLFSAPGRPPGYRVKSTFAVLILHRPGDQKLVAIKLMYSSVSSAGPEAAMVAGPSRQQVAVPRPRSKKGLKRWWSSASEILYIYCGAPLRSMTF